MKQGFLKEFLILFLLSLSILLQAQSNNLRFEPVVMPDGNAVPGNWCFLEDRRGFMWFGGLSGLFMFDGYKLTHFENNPDDSLSISDNKITALMEDNAGNLWIGTQNGLNVLDIRKKTFKRYNDENKYGLDIAWINLLKQDEKGTIWINANLKLYKFDLTTEKFIRVFPDTIKNAHIAAIEICQNKIYIITDFGLYVSNVNSNKFSLIPSKDNDSSRRLPPISNIKKDRFDNIWIGASNGFCYFDKKSNAINRVETLDKNLLIYFIQEKNDIELWLGTGNGLLVFNKKTFKYEQYTNNPSNPESVADNGVVYGFHSSHDILWMNVTDIFLHKVDMRKQKFQHIPINLFVPSVPNLFQFYEYSPNVLLMPFKEGAGLFDVKTRKISSFPYQPTENIKGWKTGITCFLEEQDGKLWIGTCGGLFLFDKNTKQFINLSAQLKEINTLNDKQIRQIHRDKDGNLWVVIWFPGFCKINFEKKIFTAYYNHIKEAKDAQLSSIRSIFEDKKGIIWVGTRDGLLKYMPADDTFKVYKNILNDPESMSENTAFCIYGDDNDNIWVGTYGGGLNKLDVKTGKFKHYTTANGLLDNNVFTLLPDKKGNLWLGTFTGISVFNLKNETFKSYKTEQGLLNGSFNAFHNGKSNYSDIIYFGGDKGIDFFDPNTIQPSTFEPNISITDFKLFNNSVPVTRKPKDSKVFSLNEDISFTKHLELKYEQNVIGFEFAALDFSAPKSIQYAYILEGFDKDWQYIGNNRNATFTNLNPGDYTFKVKSTNSDGVWSSKTTALTFTVLPPWWQTLWFRFFVLLTISSLVFAFYRYRIRQIKEKEAIKTALNKRIAEVKMEALRSQMNPHFIFNALTSINLYILKNDADTASDYLNKFSKLMREVLDHSRSDLITIEEEINTLKVYIDIEKLCFKTPLNFMLDIQPNARIRDIQVPPLIIQPYVENAIWHGLKNKKEGEATLKIAVFEESDYFYLTIEDNGVGRTKALDLKKLNFDAHKSHGLNVTEERIKQFAASYCIESSVETIDLVNANQQAMGTRIIFKIKTAN